MFKRECRFSPTCSFRICGLVRDLQKARREKPRRSRRKSTFPAKSSSIMPPPCSVIIPAPSMQSMFSLPHFGQHRLFDIFTFVSVSVFLRARESMLRTFAPFLRITKHFQSLPTPAVKRYLAARSSFGSTRILLFPSASSVSMPFLQMSASLSIA